MSSSKLHCIDLDQPVLEGFRNFISCWLYRDEKLSFVVDPGPLSTIPLLIDKLREQQVERLDYILLTHIHIDHAGGAGELLKKYPDAKVICHPNGIDHIVEPKKLWLGSQKVLGRLADIYGEIIPVPAENIDFSEQLGASGIRCFLTPGHAPHHCCYLLGDLLFGGEVAGVHSPVAKGIYMRPATPPKFILKVALDSLQRMIQLQPRQLVVGHYGLVEPAVNYLKISSKQLKLWVNVVALNIELEKEKFRSAVIEQLQREDEYFGNIYQLDEDLLAREYYFIDNTLRGMREFVLELSPAERATLATAPS